MGPPEIKMALLVLTFGFGLSIVAYSSFADQKGWPVGKWLRDATSLVSLFGFLGMISSPIVAAIFFPWWAVAVVIVAGFIVGLVATLALKIHVQYLAPLGLLDCRHSLRSAQW